MALNSEDIIKQMKAKDKQSDKKSVTKTTDLGELGNDDKNSKELQAALAKINQLEHENDNLKSQAQSEFDTKDFAKKQDAVNAILAGDEKQYFVKHYEFNAGDKKIEFNVKMHLQSIQELTQIDIKAQQLTEGMLDNLSTGLQGLYRAISTFSIVGDDVPKWFTETSGYRVDILLSVFDDYLEWSDTFREQQLQ